MKHFGLGRYPPLLNSPLSKLQILLSNYVVRSIQDVCTYIKAVSSEMMKKRKCLRLVKTKGYLFILFPFHILILQVIVLGKDLKFPIHFIIYIRLSLII